MTKFGIWICVLVATTAGVAHSDPLDEATAMAADADVHGEWLTALAAYQIAIGEGKPNSFQRARLRVVRKEAKRSANEALKFVVGAKQEQWAVNVANDIVLILPDHRRAQSTLAKGKEKGVTPGGAHEAFPARSALQRALAAQRLGTSFQKGERSLDLAIASLIAMQESDGSWDAAKHGGFERYDAGVTALALLVFLSRGANGMTEATRGAADKAARALQKIQKKEGRWSDGAVHGIYMQALATEAMAEYALVTGEKEFARPCVELGVKQMLESQNAAGGWRYQKSEAGDTSVTSRVVAALERARRLGIDVPDRALAKAAIFFNSMIDNEFGQIGYLMEGGMPARPEGLEDRFPVDRTQSMTAAGVVGLLHVRSMAPGFGISLELVRSTRPDAAVADMYYWMVGAHCLRVGTGAVDPAWYGALVESIAKLQGKTGIVHARGAWGKEGGVVYSTAACAIALAGAYRESRLIRPMVRFAKIGRRDVFVAGTSAGTPTRLLVRKGEWLKFGSTGKLEHGALRRRLDAWGAPNAGRSQPRIVKKAAFACLLARFGEKGKPLAPSLNEPFRVPQTGHLYLLVNDKARHGNEGGWTIRIERAKK